MSQFSIEIKGVDKLSQALSRLGSTAVFTKLAPAMQDALDLLVDEISVYPKKPQGSAYRRTGTLGRSWTGELVLSGDLKGKVGTNVSYAPYVQSVKKQAPIHQGRWRTIEKVTEQNESQIQEIFEQAVEDMVKDFNRQG